MQSKIFNAVLKTALFASVLLIASVSSAAEVNVYLKAQSFTKNLPDGMDGIIPVKMWGFASCTDGTFATCDANDAPGLQINAAAGDTLNIHLNNSLPLNAGNTSIMIPGQVQDRNLGGGIPVMMDGDTRRVRSLTNETMPGTPVTYTWSDLRPGTYLYQSGTHQSIQVPMGLYGALIVGDSAVSSYASTVLADGPSHYYRLGEFTTAGQAVDETGATSGGTYGSAVTPSSLGYSTDNAAGFDKTADAFVDTGVTMLSDSAFSVEAWVNANTIGTGTDGRRIVAKDEVSVQGQFILWFQGGKLRFHVRPVAASASWVYAEAPTTPPAGTTFHVVGVFDGTDAILYVDGVEVASNTVGSVTRQTTLPITIGADSDNMVSREHVFDGTIDEVAIYETALAPDRILAHYNANSYEPVLLFSEIDPIQNARVDFAAASMPLTQACVSLADYVPTVAGYPCTIDYNPFVLLVNGEPKPALPAGPPGRSALLRMLNAGLRSHTPAIVGLEMALVAEDGNAYPGLPRRQSKALLPAGKTLDAYLGVDDGAGNLVMPNGNATFGLFDREPTFSNEALPNGGGLVNLQVGTGSPAGAAPPPTFEESYNVIEDTPLTINPTGGNGVELVSGPSNGTIEVLPAPPGATTDLLRFVYTPNPDFSGTDSFVYRRQIGNTYYATLNVSFENDAPVAAADGPFVNAIGTVINVPAPGVLGNDKDVDGDVLTAVIQTTVIPDECPAAPDPLDFTLNADGSFSYTTTAGPLEFCYFADDGTGESTATSEPVLVTLEANPVPGIALTVEEPGGGAAVTEYRWTVEEDVMWQPDPSISPVDTLATNFHKSYMPIVAQGSGAAEFAMLALHPDKHYYVSVLPADAYTGAGHTIGGARISPADQIDQAVTVNVNPQPLPSAQISIFVFEDSSPTNGTVDGNERSKGLGGFQITLEDAGGRYGISAGQMSQDANGNPLKNSLDCFGGTTPPMGIILTCPVLDPRFPGVVSPLAGQVLIQNLFPGKYGIITSPPPGDETWTQTSTIEGTKVIDAWVKAGEPAFFQEFGPAGWHAFVGFVNPDNLVNPGGGNTVTGTVTNLHMSRPPSTGPGEKQLWDSESNAALAHTRAWVGLNSIGGLGDNIAAVQADADGNFTIAGVPDGNYQLVVWDSYLDQVMAYQGVTLPGGGALDTVPVFQWFARSEHNVFLDENQNGILDDGEKPIAEQAVNLRWRDGTVNQSFPTDLDGFVPFDQTFPFFHWQVLEVDFARFKATGLTTIVDGGGDVTATGGVYNPQVQGPCTQDDVDNGWNGCTTVGSAYLNPLQRTETGPVLTQGFQGFLGTTSVFNWGKAPYQPGENGGISGIVYYPSTRAENDPRLAAAEPWEPGIPGVTVRLYREVETEFDGTVLSFVDETTTDDWDNSLPTGCPGADPSDAVILGGEIDKCYDGLRNFNQARPAVFDGGYAFMDIPPGKYIVEVVPPSGYDLLKEEDNNVGYGDTYDMAPPPMLMAAAAFGLPDPAMVLETMSAEPGLAQPPCVGAEREVPANLSLFPDAMEPAPFAGAMRPLCDRKEVILSDQGQAAADFFLFTGTPIAGHFAGMILDDIAVEFSEFSPQFSEKWAPPFVPVSVRDYNGNEISRFYSDQWGRMNGLVPSTFTANMPSPSGFSPAMHTACMNDPGPIPDPNNPNQLIQDPQYNAAYSNFCYTFQYMPGTTTYLDTPVLPVSAFAAGYNPPDCTLDAGTPMIFQVDGTGVGPLVAATGIDTLRITSLGMTSVPNPAYEGPLRDLGDPALTKTILRDFGFGDTEGTVTVNGVALTDVSWSDGTITATVPTGTTTGELVVTRGDNGNSTETSVTVTVGTETPIRVLAGGSIQDAIDGASPGDLILVAPGTYDELVIMSKPVRLQGAGAGSTFINAVKRPAEKIETWRSDMERLFLADNTLPNQPAGAAGMETEEGAAITVFGHSDGSFAGFDSRIDGFSITGGDVGGGIFVNGWAHGLEITNNKVFGNNGLYAGGIRVGRPFLPTTGDGPFGFNTDVKIHNNAITQNGGLGGAGGGLSIARGTDDYMVSSNFVCGNFTTGDGGGIGHFGLSDNGMIKNNKIMFNQSFNQAVTVSGGGLFIGGERIVPEFIELDNPNGLGIGSGSVTVDANLIQGNQAASGHGGGIRTQFVNGREIVNATNPKNGNSPPGQWHSVTLTNNMIVNNVAGWSGAGISMQDTARGFVINNTIAHNDSTATVSAAFPTGIADPSANQPAGISTEPHSTALIAAIPDRSNTAGLRDFSNPVLENNIVWQNRSFHYDGVLMPALSQSAVGDCDASANYWDLGVLGGGFTLDPRFSVLTETAGFDASNIMDDPELVSDYCNGGRTLVSAPGPMTAYAAVDEGGATWIDVRFGPLVATGDYHINVDTSSARGNGIVNGNTPTTDFDGEDRPQTSVISDPPYLLVDRGADEVLDGVEFIPGDLPGTVAFTSGAFGDVLLDVATPITITAVVSGAPVTFGAQDTTDLTPFAITGDTCSTLTVAAGSECTFTVTYTPTVEVTDIGSFTVASDASGSPQTVNLSGTGIANIITFSPGAFGQVPINTIETLTVTATVLGTPPMFGGATIFGTGFAIDSQACSAATCTVTVSYSPLVVGDSAGSLTILSDGTGSPHVVDLSGSGVAQATVAYSSGDFGEVLTGTTADLTIEASVTGTTVTFEDPAATGLTGPFEVLPGDTCSGSTVTDGATCSFIVRYSPITDGSHTGSFFVGSNAAVGSQSVGLTGTGVPPGTVAFTSAIGADLIFDPALLLDFGNGGQLSSTVTLTVSDSPVTFDTVTVTGGRFDEAGGGTCEGATIVVGSTCTVVIDFNGGGNATRTGTLTVLHDGSNNPSTLSLTGN